MLHKLAQWHQTKTGLLVFAVVELGLAYVCASWAIGSGRLLAWFLTAVMLIGSLQNFAKLIAKAVRHA